MRKNLKLIEGKRAVFIGTFDKYGYKHNFGYGKTTLLFTYIIHKESGILVADHLWMNSTKQFEALGTLAKGALVEFLARVTPYVKGYNGYRDDVARSSEIDYGLSRPTKIKLLKEE